MCTLEKALWHVHKLAVLGKAESDCEAIAIVLLLTVIGRDTLLPSPGENKDAFRGECVSLYPAGALSLMDLHQHQLDLAVQSSSQAHMHHWASTFYSRFHHSEPP